MVRFKHVGEDKDWRALINQGMGVLDSGQESLEKLVTAMRRCKQRRVTNDDLRRLFTGDGRLAQLGPVNAMKVLERFWSHEEATLFGLLNAGTNVFWNENNFSAQSFSLNELVSDAILGFNPN